LSPDGGSVYVASFNSDSIGYLLRDTVSGKLEWDGCLNDDGSQTCADLPGKPLERANSVAVSPEGRSVYVGRFSGAAVARFARAQPQPPTPSAPPPPPTPPARVRIAIRRRRPFTRSGHAGPNRVRVRLRPGRYRARVIAVDAAGNRSAARTIRFRIRPAPARPPGRRSG
jgi:hypothetical protein